MFLNVSLIFDSSQISSVGFFGLLGEFSDWLPLGGWLVVFIYGEFDPGSGRTLAACLTHASRTMIPGACTGGISGERVSNT